MVRSCISILCPTTCPYLKLLGYSDRCGNRIVLVDVPLDPVELFCFPASFQDFSTFFHVLDNQLASTWAGVKMVALNSASKIDVVNFFMFSLFHCNSYTIQTLGYFITSISLIHLCILSKQLNFSHIPR